MSPPGSARTRSKRGVSVWNASSMMVIFDRLRNLNKDWSPRKVFIYTNGTTIATKAPRKIHAHYTRGNYNIIIRKVAVTMLHCPWWINFVSSQPISGAPTRLWQLINKPLGTTTTTMVVAPHQIVAIHKTRHFMSHLTERNRCSTIRLTKLSIEVSSSLSLSPARDNMKITQRLSMECSPVPPQ